MELHHLKYFVTVVEEGSVTRASQRLFLSQSALSQQIAALENEFNVKLFIRGGKRLMLSAPGQILYEYAVKILALADDACKALISYSSDQKSHRPFSVIASVGDNVLSHIGLYDVFEGWRLAHPELESGFQRTNVYRAMRALDLGHTDLVIQNLPFSDISRHPTYTVQILHFTEMFIVVSKTLYNGSSLEGFLEQLKHLHRPICMILNQGDVIWNEHIKKNILAPLGIQYTVSYEKKFSSAVDNTRFSNSMMITRIDSIQLDGFSSISTGLPAALEYTVALYKPENRLAAEFLTLFPPLPPGSLPLEEPG